MAVKNTNTLTTLLYRPSTISVVMACASGIAWAIPGWGILRKGFGVREEIDPGAIVILAAWYAVIWASFYIGEEIGAELGRGHKICDRLLCLNSGATLIHNVFIVLSAVGIAAAYYRIGRQLTLSDALAFVGSGQANELKVRLYTEYSPGLPSLRYLVVYAASLAAYKAKAQRKVTVATVISGVLLGATVVLSSRLIFMASLLTALFVVSASGRRIRVTLAKGIGSGALVFGVLALLNYSRNAGYYEEYRQSLWVAGVSEMVTYLGAPFQVALGAPRIVDRMIAGGPDTYRKYIDVGGELNTNSAFVQLYEEHGYMAWPYVALECGICGVLFAVLRSLGCSVFLLPCGAILYGAAELWRLDLYRQGIFVTWLVAGLTIPTGVFVIRRVIPITTDETCYEGGCYE